MSRTPRKFLPPLRGPVDIIGDHGCGSHAKPTNDRRDRPTICYRCNRPILNCEHRVWWSVKPLTFDEQVAKQKAEDEAAERGKTFAERMHAKREQRLREQKPPTRTWYLECKNLAVKAWTKSEARAIFKRILKGPIPKGAIITELTQ